MQKRQERDRERQERERGLRFQNDYDLDRSHRSADYGGGPGDEAPEREWAPGGVRAQQPTYPQERYQPSWSWETRDREDPRSEKERSYDPSRFRQESPPQRTEPYYGGQYEYRSPQRGPYEPHDTPHRPHESHHGMFQRFKEFIGKGPKGYKRTDERISEDIHERLAHGYLDASDIEVSVKDGEVTLTGTVRSKHDRRLAEDLVEDTLGVRELDNRLKVQKADASPPRL